jgi:L-lactate dehydrogenase complex protein LldG
MSSREKILKEIAQHKPREVPLPAAFVVERSKENLAQRFLNVLHSIGGNGKVVGGLHEVMDYLQEKISSGEKVVNGIAHLAPYPIESYRDKEAIEVEQVHTVLLEGVIGVAENSAIWLPEENMVNRLLPFLCQNLVLVIREENILANMHEAYANIAVDRDGYGVFIAGPSKTADIEQSLVIGAHGPLSLDVFVLKS